MGVPTTVRQGIFSARSVLLYLEGFLPFGQFFNTEKIQNYGIGIQFEL